MGNDETESPGPLSAIVGGDITLPPHFERNLWKALGHLGTSVSNALASLINRWTAEKQAETNARIQILEASANQTVEDLNVSPEYVREAANTFMARIVRKQINVDTIVHRAAEHISSMATEGAAEEAREISDDFLEHFGHEARKQNADWMRDLFARILAGEIQRPGSYSKKLVRTVSDLSRDVAMVFRKLCSICIAMEVDSEMVDVRAPTFAENIDGNALSDYGLHFGHLVALDEYGLIISEYNSWKEYEISVVHSVRRALYPMRYQDERWKIVPETTDKQHRLRIYGVALSQIGRELFTVVDQVEDRRYTAALHRFFHQRKMTMERS